MSLRDLLHETLRSLEANRVRSLLTILGIVIGIASVIAMTSLIGGVQNSLIDSLGLNAARSLQFSFYNGVDEDNLDMLLKLEPSLEFVEPSIDSYTQFEAKGTTFSIGITGGSPAYFDATSRHTVIEGRFFTEAENSAKSRVCLIGRNGALALFGSDLTKAISQTLKLNNKSYSVIGIVDDQNTGTEYFNAYVPYETLKKDTGGSSTRVYSAIGLAREGTDMESLKDEVVSQLATILRIDSDDDPENYFYAYSMQSYIDQLNGFMGSFQLIMGAVAGISLLVGGIGIMNMMLTNVTERIREIGIRRALGATRSDITTQFLFESVVLCIIGGIIGIVLGYTAAWALTYIASTLGLASSLGVDTGTALTPAISVGTVTVAVGISVLVGVIFGYYPARRAARLDPVECLRYQ